MMRGYWRWKLVDEDGDAVAIMAGAGFDGPHVCEAHGRRALNARVLTEVIPGKAGRLVDAEGDLDDGEAR